MLDRVLSVAISLKYHPPSPPPTPPPPSPVLPVPPVPTPQPNTFGGGLTSVFLILIILILIGIIIWIAWMFKARRWVSTRTVAAGTLLVNKRSRDSIPTEYSSLPNQSRISPRSYPVQVVSPPLPLPADLAHVAPTSSTEDQLNNKPWLHLVEECVTLFDELDRPFSDSDPRREIATHVKYRLQEILGRSGVKTISRSQIFDIHRHQLDQPGVTAAQGSPITQIVSPGFAVGRRVLRRAKVRVASLSQDEIERND